MDLHVACRKCENCLRRRAAMWRIRSYAEWRRASRTWLCTFTLRPASLVYLLSHARVRLGKAGTDYEALDAHERFLELDNYGMAVNDALVKTRALELGLIAQGEEMTLAARQAKAKLLRLRWTWN